jgi:tRNA (guanosine-2'-O-)-methyltransferase
VNIPRSPRRIARFRQVLEQRQPDLTVVMENIHDPHNVSAILRTADAVGVARIDLLYTVEPFPKIGRKSSSSANKWIDRRRYTSVAACFDALHAEGFRVYATRLGTGTVPLYDVDLTGRVALVLGNEHRGVSEEAAAAADGLLSIPMMGMIESLNVSVAAAVCLYEALRQRLAAGSYRNPSYPPEALERLLQEWLQR